MSTFVLIPGAGGAAWYWHRVVPLLQQAGHDAVAVDLPGDSDEAALPEYARLVADAAAGREDVVLVALSLGGFTAPMAAALTPVSGLVFVNAMIPVPGETARAWWDNTGAPAARETAARQHGYGTEFDLNVYFLHDVPPGVAAAGEGEVRPEADAAFDSPCDFSRWPDVPIRAVAGEGDRFFPADFQRRVAAERLGLELDLLPGGHLIALAQPGPLARYLLT